MLAATPNDGMTTDATLSSATPPAAAVGQSGSAANADQTDLAQVKEMLKSLPSPASESLTVQTNKAQWTPEVAERMSAGIFVFGFLLFLMLSILIWKNKSVDTLLRTFGILLIIVASVFLVIAGYSDQQIAPVMGLMGTIAGYLLSRRTDPAPAATAAPRPDDTGDGSGAK